MEGIIRVAPAELIGKAEEFSSQGSIISALTSEMTNTVTGMTSVWEGEASAAYLAKFRGLDDDIQKMIRMIQEHASDLREMASIYEQTEAQNMEDIGTLSSDVIV